MPNRDWKSLAQANGLPLSAKELDAISAPLESLEAAFAPLVRDLPTDLEPALMFRVEAEGE